MSQGHQSQRGPTRIQGGGHFDIHAAARQVLVAAKFVPDLDAAARQQTDQLTAAAAMPPGVKDLRDRPWSSIDNNESRDLDQIEIAESLPDGTVRLIVAIADVD